MEPHQNDSFGLFADVLAGTLGIVALIALLMVLAAGDWHVTPEVTHRDELRSAALPEQILVAKKHAAQSTERLRGEVERVAPLVGLPPQALINAVQAEAGARYDLLTNGVDPKANPGALALRRENLRLGQKVADLTVMNGALEAMVAHLRERPHPVATEQRLEPAVPLRVLREGRETPKPYYLICRAGKIYAAFVFVGDSVQPNRQDLSWIQLPGGRRTRCLPIADRGWNLAEAGEQLKAIGPQLVQHPDYYAVVLAFPDSYLEARELLRLLDGANVAFSWRPHAAGESVEFAADGAIPPPPL